MSAEAKLLVVDDEFNILELLATSLRFAGFEVVTAGNGREALEKAHAENPDLIGRDPLSSFLRSTVSMVFLHNH